MPCDADIDCRVEPSGLNDEVVQLFAQPREDALEHSKRTDLGIAICLREVLRLHPANLIGYQRSGCSPR